jgi:hypothetical protein
MFLTHGHQGTRDSDMYLGAKTGEKNELAVISKWLVHNFWRPVQRITGIPSNTPAKNWELLSQRHDLAMYKWADTQPKTVLITGHTHQPVFASNLHLAKLQKELAQASQEIAHLAGEANKLGKLEQIGRIAAQIEWVRAKNEQAGPQQETPFEFKPCYFNTGCCSFADGDVTGLEISNGTMRLVRWPDDNGEPLPKVLDDMPIADIFSGLG